MMKICGIPVLPHPTLMAQYPYEFVLVFTTVAPSSSFQPPLQLQGDEAHLHHPNNNITIVALNRPKKHNAINMKMWFEIGHVFTQLETLQDCSAIVLMGMGKSFCSGIDISDTTNFLFSADTSSSSSILPSNQSKNDTATAVPIVQQRRNAAAQLLLPHIQQMQECFTALERCSIPIIAVIHGYCIGAGIDLICCTDIRICCSNSCVGTTPTTNNSNNTANTIFAVKEVQMGFAPDVGTLQRLPKICGANQSIVHELCYTGRNFDASEAMEIGLVSPRHCRSTLAECLNVAINDLAAAMVALPNPTAVRHIKQSLLYTRDHPNVAEGLEHIAKINAYALQSTAMRRAIQQQLQKGKSKPLTTSRKNQHVDIESTANLSKNDYCHRNNKDTTTFKHDGGANIVSSTFAQQQQHHQQQRPHSKL